MTALTAITGNVAIGDAGHGFNINRVAYIPGPRTLAPPDEQPHFVDGGHNVAFGNALDPQCIGVACWP